ncbi:MAG: NfeD family protein [Erysipelotrichaceae bacterium]|nr:NfeD family protein [Erysipelotrichaceae bacterium]
MGFMFWGWIIILIVSVIIEIATNDLTSIWFAAGAFGAIISNLFLHDTLIYVQIIVFAIISIAFILIVKPIIKKRINVPVVATNVDAMIGQKVLVVEKIEEGLPGAVKSEGIEWTAVTDKETCLPGDFVIIKKVVGNTLTVEKFIGKEEKE